MAKPTLKFHPAGPLEGFRPTGLSMVNNIDPDTLLRELIQNGLDAFLQAKKGSDTAHIHFHIEEMKTKSISVISNYREHFEGAIETQRRAKTLQQAKGITDAMQETLDADKSSILWVMDNGIGLSPDNMNRLLSDGASTKSDEKSTGSYGNGHMTTFPASDLRYIVYGGVFEQHGKKRRIAAGQTILATHALNGENYGKDGFLVAKLEEDLIDRFLYYWDGDVPKIISKKLDWIEEEYGTGSVVGILGFNRFNRYDDDQEVVREIERVSATHFAPAIHAGKMNIHVKAPSWEESVIDRNRLREILENYKERIRRKNHSIGPSGRQAWDAAITLDEANRINIETSFGSVPVAFRQYTSELMEGGGGTHLQLYRNGMWVTNAIHLNQPANFGRSAPFNALILLDPDLAGEACNLIRDAEGPRHIDLDLSRLGRKGTSKKREQFDKLFQEIHAQLREFAPELEAREIDPGFFSVEVTGGGREKNPKSPKGSVGRPERQNQPDPQVYPGGERLGPYPPNPSPIKRHGSHLKVQQASVWENGGMQIRLKPLEKNRNVELRLVHASGADKTCDSPPADQFLEICGDPTLDGKRVENVHKDANGQRVSIDLGKLDLGKEVDIQVPCQHPGHGSVRVEVIKRATSKQETSK